MMEAIRRQLPKSWNRYFEPMVGGAALFFCICPSTATLSDLNDELMNFYAVLKSLPLELEHRLCGLRASREFYYAIRRSRPRASLQRAVRFAYLNRLAWNGLYRVNRSGHFNVPMGDRLPATLWNFSDLRLASAALANTTLRSGDFADVLRYAREGDFVFLDPPYPRGAIGDVGFNRYAAAFFTAEDHDRLSRVVLRLSERGVKLMLTLANRDGLQARYPKEMKRVLVRSKALIACNGHDRRAVAELILTNY